MKFSIGHQSSTREKNMRILYEKIILYDFFLFNSFFFFFFNELSFLKFILRGGRSGVGEATSKESHLKDPVVDEEHKGPVGLDGRSWSYHCSGHHYLSCKHKIEDHSLYTPMAVIL